MVNRLFHVPRFVKWVYPSQIWSFDTPNVVYITFDDGPHPQITERLLDILKQYEVRATFFVLGEKAEKYPELMVKIQEAGHEIGNHGYLHLNGLETDAEEYFENYRKGIPFQTINYFRPPYGKISRSMAARIGSSTKLAMWSWLSYDYDAECSDEQIIKNLKKHVKGGDVLVFHENDKTIDRFEVMVTAAIRILRDKGFEFKAFPTDNTEK
jgi:peptidoglycan-N-acetylglucosamine deacetylase